MTQEEIAKIIDTWAEAVVTKKEEVMAAYLSTSFTPEEDFRHNTNLWKAMVSYDDVKVLHLMFASYLAAKSTTQL